MIGERLAQYELVALLGEGGMGAVYRAVDSRLGRTVALKVVSEQLTRDPDAHARLMREARMAAALNHPNICTIHDVLDLSEAGARQGTPAGAAIVFELVEGQTLAARIAGSGALPPKALLDIAVQIAEGLAAAHSRHIVHRDLKPQNIVITSDERVKILDFGLARLSSTIASDPLLSTHTDFDISRRAGAEGPTGGTVPYMSPEQAAGKPLDSRSDLFSFGTVLHEMAAGRRPFRGDTTVEILSKILEAEPESLTTVRPELPASFARVVRRCLQKRPEDRYQDTRDVLADLREIHDSLRGSGRVTVPTAVVESTAAERSRPPSGHPLRRKWLMALAGVAVLALTMSAAVLLTKWRRVPAPAAAVHRQVTYVGDASLPAVSPDGAFVAYVRGEPWGHLFATVLPRAPQRVVIHDLASGGRDLDVGECDSCWSLVWSPDGRSLLMAGVSGFSVVPRLGGTPRQFDGRGRAAWSPDGTHFVYGGAGGTREIRFIEIDTGKVRLVPLKWASAQVHGLDWAPHRQVAVLTRDANRGDAIWSVSPDGSQQERIAEETRPIRSIKWAPDGESLYYIRGEDADELVAIRLSSTGLVRDQPSVIVSGIPMGPHFSVTRDGRTMVYTRELRYANLWSASLATKGGKPPTQITTGSSVDQFPSVSPKGDTIAFVRIAGGVAHVFTMPVAGGAPQPLSSLTAAHGAPAWSPDGGSLAVCAASSGEYMIWAFDLEKRSPPRAFEATRCASSGSEAPVAWAPRREILYQRPGNRNFHVLEPDTAAETPLLQDEQLGWIFSPRTSPDGTVMAAYWNRGLEGSRETGRGIWLFVASGSPPTRIHTGFSWPLAWTSDGQAVLAYEPYKAEIIAVPKSGGSATVVGVLNAARVGLAPALTPDGRTVIYSAHAIHADVWALENFDPQRR